MITPSLSYRTRSRLSPSTQPIVRSAVPPAIRALGGPHRDEAIRRLRRCLEYQDGVIQATPFAVRFLLRMRPVDPAGVQAILGPIAASARFMIESYGKPLPEPDWHALFSEQRLWPEFTNELDDEARWEEWEPSEDERIGWAILTERELSEAAILRGP